MEFICIGVGKTTVCKKIVSILEKKSKNFDGFYTEEVRDHSGSRIGFDIVRVQDPETRLSLARLKCVFLLDICMIHNETRATENIVLD